MPAEPKELAQYQSDHDLLIRLTTKMDDVQTSIRRIEDDTARTVADHENRIRFLEKSIDSVATAKTESDKLTRMGGTILIFIVGIAEFVISQVFK